MRKMLSRKQTIDLVNEAIESGEIHADPSTEVKVGDINSESATAGKVIVADGEGGAEWGTIQAGTEVVELTNSSGTLTDEQYAKVAGDNCVILYQNLVYRKRSMFVAYDEIYYEILPIITANYIIENKVKITISSKAYSFSNEQFNKRDIEISPSGEPQSYPSKIQFGTIVYGFKGNEQVVAYEGESGLPTDVAFTQWALHRAIKDGNTLWVVVAGSIENNSGSATTPDLLCTITLPESISSHIYRQDGTTLNNTSSNSMILTACGTSSSAVARFSIISGGTNIIEVHQSAGGQSIPSGSSGRIDLRIPLFLDIGTIQ